MASTRRQLASIKKLSASFQRHLLAHFRKHGREIDNVGNLTRNYRLPGTFNHKNSPPTLVQLASPQRGHRHPIETFKSLVCLRATLRLNSPQRRFTTASLKPAAGTEQLSLRVPRHAVSLTGMRGLRLLRAVLVEKRSFTSTAGCIPVTTWRRRQRNSVALRLRAAPEPARYREGFGLWRMS